MSQPINPATQAYVECTTGLYGWTCNYCLANWEGEAAKWTPYEAVVDVTFGEIFAHFDRYHRDVVTFKIDLTDIDLEVESLEGL